jgi:hypothetical protein
VPEPNPHLLLHRIILIAMALPFKWPFKSVWVNLGVAFAGLVMVGGEAGFYFTLYKAKYGKPLAVEEGAAKESERPSD